MFFSFTMRFLCLVLKIAMSAPHWNNYRTIAFIVYNNDVITCCFGQLHRIM